MEKWATHQTSDPERSVKRHFSKFLLQINDLNVVGQCVSWAARSYKIIDLSYTKVVQRVEDNDPHYVECRVAGT